MHTSHPLQHKEVAQLRLSLLAGLAQKSGGRLSQVAAELGYATDSDEDSVRVVAAAMGLAMVDLNSLAIDLSLLEDFPVPLVHKYGVFPLRKEAGSLVLAISNPLDLAGVDAVAAKMNMSVVPVLASPADVARLIRCHLGDGQETTTSAEEPHADLEDVLEHAARHREHPLVRSYLTLLEDLKATKDAPNATLRGDARVTTLLAQLEKVCRLLDDDPALASTSEDPVTEFCRPVEWPRCAPARPSELEVVLQHLQADSPVLLVGAPGSGRNTLAGFVAKRLFEQSAQKRPQPIRLIAPLHQKMRVTENRDTYRDALLRIVHAVKSSQRDILCVPEIHACCDEAPSVRDVADAWSMLIPEILSHKVPLLSWTSECELPVLRAAWPRFLQEVRMVPLADLARDQLRTVLEDRVAFLVRARKVRFSGRFVEAIIASRGQWRPAVQYAEPSHSLRFLDSLVRFAEKQRAKEEAAPSSENRLAKEIGQLRVRIHAELARDNYVAVRQLALGLEKLQMAVERLRPDQWLSNAVVVLKDIDDFLRSDNA